MKTNKLFQVLLEKKTVEIKLGNSLNGHFQGTFQPLIVKGFFTISQRAIPREHSQAADRLQH